MDVPALNERMENSGAQICRKRGSHEHPDKDRKHNDYVSNVMALMIFLIMSENCTFVRIYLDRIVF